MVYVFSFREQKSFCTVDCCSLELLLNDVTHHVERWTRPIQKLNIAEFNSLLL